MKIFAEQIRDSQIYLRNKRDDLKWIKGVDKSFRFLLRWFTGKTLYVNDWAQKPASWLDVRIKLPILWKNFWCLRFAFRWIFTVSGKTWMQHEISASELSTMIYKKVPGKDLLKFFKMTGPQIYEYIDKNNKRLKLFPVVWDFDNIYDWKDGFSNDDVVTYTKLWLKEHCPRLASWDVKYIEDD